jgi:serralysin
LVAPDPSKIDGSETAVKGARAIIGKGSLTLSASANSGASNFASGDAGDDTINLSLSTGGWDERADGTNAAHGGDGADILDVSLELRTANYGGEEELLPLRGLNLVYGDAGDDRLSASIAVEDTSELDFARSELYGGAGNDRLRVSGGEGNLLYGNLDNDTLIGGNGSDRLIGGQGADYLRGDGGDDVFVFEVAGGASAAERDRIADFTIGDDLIDVSKIDAKSWKSGNQSFVFDERGSGRSGTLWVEDNPDDHGSIAYANTGKALLVVDLLDGRGMNAHDYSASDFIL